MARAVDRLPENAPGDFYVDSSCIDCAVCRELAPATFAIEKSATDQSYVHVQPDGDAERLRAAMALVSCPTSSIGSSSTLDLAAAKAALPDRVTHDVWFCGYASERSYGAQSYFIARPGGNVLVDSPRYVPALADRLEALGGVALMFLTHADDVADHEKFHDRFGCERVIHARDVGADTREVEQKLDGTEPVRLAEDLLVLPVPGHTRGSACLLYRDDVLFTGDHLWGSEDGARLSASRSVCWHSWPEQKRSMERLLAHRFTRVLPGHGRRFHAEAAEAMHAALETLIARM